MRSGRYNDAELEAQLDKRRLMNRFFGPIARRADTPRKMYPVGVLFGLGFDTTTEVALVVLAGSAVAGRWRRAGGALRPSRSARQPARTGPRACRVRRIRIVSSNGS